MKAFLKLGLGDSMGVQYHCQSGCVVNYCDGDII